MTNAQAYFDAARELAALRQQRAQLQTQLDGLVTPITQAEALTNKTREHSCGKLRPVNLRKRGNTMKTLIAVTTCHGVTFQFHALSQLATWGKDVLNKKALQLSNGGSDANITDLKFFLGRSEDTRIPQRKPHWWEVFLDCPDGYEDRKEKMLAIFRWAFEHGYDYVWKIDDDVYLRPERLLTIPPHDYCGMIVDMNYRIETDGDGDKKLVAQIRTALGGIYGLSRRSLECLLAKNAALPVFDHFEDGWVSEQLRSFGILPTRLNERIGYTHIKGVGGWWKGRDEDMVVKEPPTPNNDVVASFEYNQYQMLEIHMAFNGVCDVWATTSTKKGETT